MRYHDTYWYAQVVNRTITDDQAAYLLTLNEFYGDGRCIQFLAPFPKWTALHAYALFVIERVEVENLPGEASPYFLKWRDKGFGPPVHATPIEADLDAHGIEHQSFSDWSRERGLSVEAAEGDDFSDYYESLGGCWVDDGQADPEGPRGELFHRMVEEIFHLGFLNRTLLLALNKHIAWAVADYRLDDVGEDHREHFQREGVLRRGSIPKWAKRAVFFRDRGRCVLCRRDLSDLLTLESRAAFDHMVPLAQGGINDVANLQLLCRECNSRKGAGIPVTQNTAEPWF